MIPAEIAAEEKPFSGARAQFDAVVSSLTDRAEQSTPLRHSDLEQYLKSEGTELLRQLLQDAIDLRSWSDAGPSVRAADDALLNHQRERGVQLETIFGTVRVCRQVYSAAGHHAVAPLDADLNLPAERHSFGVQKVMAVEVARGSFDEAVACLDRCTGATIGKRKAEELAVAAARDFDAFYASTGTAVMNAATAHVRPALTSGSNTQQQHQGDIANDNAESSSVLVLSTDAKGVLVHVEDLRSATQKAARARQHKLESRLSPGEKRHAKRMAQVVAVYSLLAVPRTPQDIIKDSAYPAAPSAPRPRPSQKRVWASLEKDAKKLIEEGFAEAQARDPYHKLRWVVLVDGQLSQLDTVRRLAEQYGVNVTIVVDFIHVLEYLWNAAWCFFERGDPSVDAWVRQRALEILRGHASRVAGGIRRTATKRRLRRRRRRGADNCADYLLDYAAYLRYDAYLAAGFPIATGVIEGACRYLVQDRLGITGARWRLARAEAVLRLRALRSSGDFEAYWTFHEAAELQRNHLSQYLGAMAPTLTPPRTQHCRHRLRLVQ